MKLSPKVAPKTRMKTTFVYAAWTLGIASFITGLAFLYFNLGYYEQVYAAGSTYTSTRTGNWTTNSTWTGGTTPPTTDINGDDITIRTNHTVNSGTLTAKNNAIITIQTSAVLYITGDLIVDNNFTLNNSGSLVITGDLITKNGANVTINGGGNMKVFGDASFAQNAILKVNGTLNVAGAITFGANPSFFGTGAVVTGSGCGSWTGVGTCSMGSLPVKLVSFKAKNYNGVVKISWQTASEENNDFFTVSRTTDGENYTSVATIPGAGTTGKLSSYEFEDVSPLEGKSYYMLTQTDFDGKTESFSTVEVEVEASPVGFSIYPNPLVGNVLNVSISNPEEGSVEIRDMRGNPIIAKVVHNGDSNFKLNLSNNLQAGVYYIHYKTATTVKVERFVKQN